jgi:hypothetical protein
MSIRDRYPDHDADRMRSERPRRRRGRDEDDYDDDAPRPSAKGGGSSLPLILGLCGAGALLLVLAACGSCLYFVPIKFTPNPPVAINDPPRPGWGPGGPPPDVVPPPAPPVQPEAPKPDPQPPKNDPPRKPPVVPKNEPPPPPPPVRWQVRPDPLPAGLALADRPEGPIPITGYPPAPNNLVDQVVFPTSPSPFVSVAVKGRIHDAHEVWDLRTMKRVGVTIDPEHPFTRAVLSPDGAWWAKPTFQLGNSGGADVYDVSDGRLYHMTVGDKSRWFENLDFGGPGQVVTLLDVVGKGGLELLVQVWDIKTRTELRRFTAPAQLDAMARLDANQRAFSAGRRYLALVRRDNVRVLLYDLTSGELCGELPLPAGSACQGLSFAADGKALAGLIKAGGVMHLLAWDLATGKKTADHKFDKEPVTNPGAIRGPAVEWLPKGGGWLLYGQALVDAQSGSVYWRIPVEGADGTQPRHIFGDGVLAYVKGDAAGPPREGRAGRGRGNRGSTKSLVFEPLPADEVAAALKAARGG